MSTLRNLVMELEAEEGLKTNLKQCKVCKELLPINNFYKEKRNRDGLDCNCKKCQSLRAKIYRKNNPPSEEQKEKRKERWKKWIANNKERKITVTNKWRKNNPKRYKDSFLKRKYGITTDAYNKVLSNQSNSCAICGIPDSDLNYPMFIDHCHIAGKFRGLLCRNCNSGIGYFKDNIEIIKNSISYLEKFKEHVNS